MFWYYVKDQLMILMKALVQQRKKLALILQKQNKVFLEFSYHSDQSYFYVNKTKICEFGLPNKNTLV